MKKFFTFLSLALTLLFVFGCDLQLPKEIQIKGSPELKFSANWEADIFSDMIKSAFGGDSDDSTKIYECINAPQYKTFLIRMEIFNGRVSLESDLNTSGSDTKFTLANDRSLISSEDDNPITLPFSGFGDYLDGFKLKTDGIESRLYVGGSEIVTAVTIKLTADDTPLPPKQPSKNSSLPNDAHTLRALPANDGGIKDVFPPELLNAGKNVNIEYEIYLAQGEEIETAWLGKDYDIKAELIIWIPLVLVAEKDKAEISFNSLDGIGSFLASMSESGFIESLNLAVEMSANPFIGGTLVMQDSNHEITSSISANALNFSLNEKDVKYINDNPFDPKLSIKFNKDYELKIPKDFSIATVSMTAKLNFTVELGGN